MIEITIECLVIMISNEYANTQYDLFLGDTGNSFKGGCSDLMAADVNIALQTTGYGFVDFDSPAAALKAVHALKTSGIQAQMAKVSLLQARVYVCVCVCVHVCHACEHFFGRMLF